MPKIMEAFQINEISGVDRPAQEGARMLIMKRQHQDDPEKARRKKHRVDKNDGTIVVLTTEEDGHSHAVWIYQGNTGGATSHGRNPEDDRDHDHPWVFDSDGRIVIGINDGHTHAVDQDQLLQALLVVASSRVADEVAVLLGKREFSSEERERLAKEGLALPDGSFPIVTTTDLRNAIAAFGRAANKREAAQHIKRRAVSLGATDLLPDEGRLADLVKAAGETGTVGEENAIMTDTKKAADNKPTVEDLTEQLAEATATALKAEAIASLNDAEKAHLKTLKGVEADAFIAKSVDERGVIIKEIAKAASDSDPVVYKADDGTEYRKSDDARLVNMAKNADIDRNARKQAEAKVADAELVKRAEELSHLPGDIEARKAMLKAIDGIQDQDARKRSLEALKAQNKALASAFKSIGVANANEAEDGPEAKLNKMAEDYSKQHGMTFQKAFVEVAKTPAGRELYRELRTN